MHALALSTLPAPTLRPILPPPEARSQAQRVLAASQEWADAMVFARNFDSLSKENGSHLFASMSRFIHELIDSNLLRQRMVLLLEQKLSNDFVFRDFGLADKEWREVISVATGYCEGKSPISATRLFLALGGFFQRLFNNQDLCDSAAQYIKQKLREDFPPEQGRLF